MGFKVFQLIQTIQLTFFLIHPYFSFWPENEVFGYIRYVITYFQFFGVLMDNQSQTLLIALLYVTIGVIMVNTAVYLILLVRCRRGSSIRSNGAIRILSEYGVILLNLLDTSFLTILFSVVYCAPDSRLNMSSECYSNENYFHVVMASLALLLLFIQLNFFSIFLIDNNVFSKCPYATLNHKINNLK